MLQLLLVRRVISHQDLTKLLEVDDYATLGEYYKGAVLEVKGSSETGNNLDYEDVLKETDED